MFPQLQTKPTKELAALMALLRKYQKCSAIDWRAFTLMPLHSFDEWLRILLAHDRQIACKMWCPAKKYAPITSLKKEVTCSVKVNGH